MPAWRAAALAANRLAKQESRETSKAGTIRRGRSGVCARQEADEVRAGARPVMSDARQNPGT
jgi:hypothetical protein